MKTKTDLYEAFDGAFSHGQIDLVMSLHPKATPTQVGEFLYTAMATGLDPLTRQLHLIVGKTGRTVIVTGIDGYRAVAARTGQYGGNDDYLFDGGDTQFAVVAREQRFPVTATATVYRVVAGQRVPFSATAGWREYNGNNAQWSKMPFLMLGKCAEALALRKAFPAELSGVYTVEEMDQANREPDSLDQVALPKVEPTTTAKAPTSDDPPKAKAKAKAKASVPSRTAQEAKAPTTAAKAETAGGPRPTKGKTKAPTKAQVAKALKAAGVDDLDGVAELVGGTRWAGLTTAHTALITRVARNAKAAAVPLTALLGYCWANGLVFHEDTIVAYVESQQGQYVVRPVDQHGEPYPHAVVPGAWALEDEAVEVAQEAAAAQAKRMGVFMDGGKVLTVEVDGQVVRNMALISDD